jgi:hypothetical protein
MEFQWDQIPHWFSDGVAKTPYTMSTGHTSIYTLASRPTATGSGGTTLVGTDVRDWVNNVASPLNLSLYKRHCAFQHSVIPQRRMDVYRKYWQNHNVGDRAFGTLFGISPGNYNISELAEPIDYQTYNVELERRIRR